MTRRFQFSLRWLLAAMVLLCIAMGAWHIYVTHFAAFVAADSTLVGRKIAITGRFIRIGGKPSTVVSIQIRPTGKNIIYQSGGKIIQRTGWGIYEYSIDLNPIVDPGDYEISVYNHKDTVAKGPLTIVADQTQALK